MKLCFFGFSLDQEQKLFPVDLWDALLSDGIPQLNLLRKSISHLQMPPRFHYSLGE